MTASTSTPIATAAIVRPGEGSVARAFGNEILFKLGEERTAGALSLGLATAPNGTDGPPPHVHHGEDELFLILEGTYRVWIEGTWSEAGPGSVVYFPRRTAHTFHVVGDVPGRHWVLTTSSAFEQFYMRCAELFAEPGPPDRARLAAISAAHGMEIVRPA